jgi:alkylhydroperoxidase family enzyme
MGHAEMLLAVAGVEKEAVRERFRRLAGGDWSQLTPQERAAFAFARKLSQDAAGLTGADVDELVRHLGTERALDVIWWTCQCHYMTRIADAFQLPLEIVNVYEGS